jgi:hypothetical protein
MKDALFMSGYFLGEKEIKVKKCNVHVVHPGITRRFDPKAMKTGRI